MSDIITATEFLNRLQTRLGEHDKRALIIFNDYGEILSWDVTNVLLHALDKNKVDEVLTELERYYKEVLVNQHPEVRGRVTDTFGANPTQTMFNNICVNILQLEPVKPN